jgi:hypothetical protein
VRRVELTGDDCREALRQLHERMLESLIDSMRHAWPFYLIALAGAELILYMWTTRGWRYVLPAAGIMFVLLLFVSHGASSAWDRDNQLAKLLVVNAINLAVPMALLVLAVFFAKKVSSPPARHVVLAVAVFFVMFLSPLGALMVVCSSGLDCL